MKLLKDLMIKRNILAGIPVFILLAFTAMAFQDPNNITVQQKKVLVDSPRPDNIHIDIDMKDLEQNIKKSMEMAEKAMKEIDFTALGNKINESMKQIDMAKIQLDIEKAMKDVDWNKIKTEIDQSMKVDMDKFKVDMEKMKEELKLSMKDINTEELKKSMEELKKINYDEVKKEMEKVKKEMNLNKDQWKAEMEKAKVEMEKAREGLTDMRNMANELEKDGLINKTESNNIEFKDKDLYINGKKQSPEISDKYRKYFKGENLKFKFSFEK